MVLDENEVDESCENYHRNILLIVRHGNDRMSKKWSPWCANLCCLIHSYSTNPNFVVLLLFCYTSSLFTHLLKMRIFRAIRCAFDEKPRTSARDDVIFSIGFHHKLTLINVSCHPVHGPIKVLSFVFLVPLHFLTFFDGLVTFQ